ncbi:carbohydrate kinase family protein [Niabella ginsengisoli]|uniref:Carbohydrate kinase n=1 Tax=Niabella ginsengisoli TaxID=522298 RepID=A0ABS9SQH8_9BACT|nr:carbohydrate kinase [Niabella ginsengisoli]MCH5600521.1 carbohydrate kinase [Niabella ginsengisoli]
MNTICFGEILWDVLPNEKVPGGAPMNVCYHLNRLGQSAAIISKIGNDENGSDLMKFLDSSQVNTKLVQVDEEHQTGIVIATQKGNEMEYDIVQPVAWDFIDSPKALLDEVSRADYFVCGSLAARHGHSRKSLYALLEAAKTKVVDINLRPPHYERSTLEYLLQQADILKLNNHELAMISASYSTENDFAKQVQLLSEKFAISTIIVTKGEAGAALLFQNKFYYHDGFKVKVADTIGSGDAFLAGFLSKHIHNESPETALEFACKIGAFVASQKGACPKYEIEQVEKAP